MFCPSCGTEYTIELKYCNRCGANLSPSGTLQTTPVVVSVTKPILLLGALLVFLTLGGFGMLISGAMGLAPFVHGSDPLIAMIFVGMVTILTIDIFVVRLLTKLINAALSPPQLQAPPQPRMMAPPTQQFQTAPVRLQAASVTENTTRFFESPAPTAEPVNRVTAEKLDN
jgi:hypothetical protein